MLSRYKLSTRILFLGIAIMFGFALLIAWLYPTFKGTLYAAKYVKTRHLVEVAHSALAQYAARVESGELTLETAQAQALHAIRAMRYEQSEYFWINDLAPRMIMHPINPALDGKPLHENKDPNGKHLFVEFVNVCKRSGAGFVEYLWPKPDEPKPVPKISYVKLLPAWGWIVGSGVYIDDVEKELTRVFLPIAAVALALCAAGLALSGLMARSIARPVARIIHELSTGSEEISAAAAQVSATSQSLAEGASEQAASIEETSASLEEMASMTQQNADHARQANHLMTETNTVVVEANTSMHELTGSMQAISSASEETSKIIKTIDEIAFQTNLLALNAAVEAARAGEAGAGFAVVADEVRNLAMRAAEAARNTARLIEDTVTRVKDGAALVARTSEKFTGVASSAAKVGELVGEIATASSEQAQGITQVNTAVSEMDKVTQQNAAGAEESASASEQLNAQSEQLKAMVGDLMRVVEGHRPSAAPRASGAQGRPAREPHAAGGVRSKAKTPRQRASAAKLIPFDDADLKAF
jgi:methyl-accepting chemotaxis protein